MLNEVDCTEDSAVSRKVVLLTILFRLDGDGLEQIRRESKSFPEAAVDASNSE